MHRKGHRGVRKRGLQGPEGRVHRGEEGVQDPGSPRFRGREEFRVLRGAFTILNTEFTAWSREFTAWKGLFTALREDFTTRGATGSAGGRSSAV